MPDIGSSEWWAAESDKLVNFGLGVLSTKLLGGGGTSGQQTQPTTSTMAKTPMITWAILGVIGVAVVVIIAKR